MEHLQPGEQALQQDQAAIAGYFARALNEVSTVLGGEELAAEIVGLPTDSGTWLVDALRLLEDRHPGAAEQVFSLAEAAQAEAHAIPQSE